METVQQNGRFTLFSSKFHSNIYSILIESIRDYQTPRKTGVHTSNRHQEKQEYTLQIDIKKYRKKDMIRANKFSFICPMLEVV